MQPSILDPRSSILDPRSSILLSDPGARKQVAGSFKNQVFGRIGRVAGPILMDLINRVLPAQDDLIAAAVVQNEVVIFGVTVPIDSSLILGRHQMGIFPASAVY